MATRKASGESDAAKRSQVYASYLELPGDRATARAQLRSNGTDALLVNCITWGKSALTNLEADYAAPLATVRPMPAH